jgi:hypothetical protein
MQPGAFQQLLLWNHWALSRGQSQKLAVISLFIYKAK